MEGKTSRRYDNSKWARYSKRFLACGDENIFISGYVDHRGSVVQNLQLEEIERGIELFKQGV